MRCTRGARRLPPRLPVACCRTRQPAMASSRSARCPPVRAIRRNASRRTPRPRPVFLRFASGGRAASRSRRCGVRGRAQARVPARQAKRPASMPEPGGDRGAGSCLRTRRFCHSSRRCAGFSNRLRPTRIGSSRPPPVRHEPGGRNITGADPGGVVGQEFTGFPDPAVRAVANADGYPPERMVRARRSQRCVSRLSHADPAALVRRA